MLSAGALTHGHDGICIMAEIEESWARVTAWLAANAPALFGRHVAGDGMAVDQRPGPGQGAVGEFNHEDSTKFTMGASLGEYVAKVADSLENGTNFLYLRPYAEDGGSLAWDVIDDVDED